jgi:RND family efflux transporter MFP subunit
MKWMGFLLGLAACSGSGAEPKKESKPAGVPIKVGAVEERTIDRAIEISGSLAAPESPTVAAEVEGKLTAIRVDLGDYVGKGQVLALINPREYRALNEQADSRRGQAKAELQRAEELAKKELISAQQLDDARAKLKQAEAAAEISQKKLEDTEVRAPFSGAVAKRLVSTGEYVRPGTPLLQLVAIDPLKISGEVPERWLASVNAGDAVTAEVDAFRGQSFAGKIGRVSPAVNPASRTFTVEAMVANPKRALKPGLFAHARVNLGQKEKVLVVPDAAVATFAGNSKVFEIADDRAREHAVTVGERLGDGTIVIVTGGLKPGARVATAGLARLADGVEVVVK